ncbi:hypothetical protein SAMN05880590_10126 [Rhizobium sp. RU35A]|uniref:hypothetical protein n=1 Tax=Rhizobium sp. RU35A TaxID=1907414 RepID=UPI000956632B|nr:hypothetical protein [Rhizobium sp. RU35A]SIP89132.1 hypothetical protein SAMN05880590_10126 [Rhizobium sp. RU35A]
MAVLSTITPVHVAMLLLIFWISVSLLSLAAFARVNLRRGPQAMTLAGGAAVIALATIILLVWAGLRS